MAALMQGIGWSNMALMHHPTIEHEVSETVPGASLEAVLCIRELEKRPDRPRDEQRLKSAIDSLLRGFTSSPETVLQSLADTILSTLQSDSAGVSLINSARTRFYWPAIAGVWAPHIGAGTPLHFGPCGDVMDAGTSLHMREVHKRYTYFSKVELVREALLVPFAIDGAMRGTIWAVTHNPPHDVRSRLRPPFDREDMRLLEALGNLAASAFKIWDSNPNPPRQ